EPALEVGTPNGVRRVVLAQPLAVRRASADASPPPHEPVALQEIADRARGRQRHARLPSLEHDPQLARSPARMPASNRDDRLDDRGWDRIGMRAGCPRAVLE